MSELIFITQMLKATPAEEGGERFIYLEASNEALDVQNEVVLAKALEESADYYLRYGNIDLDHVTQVGAKSGISDYNLYEIGRPVEVRVDGKCTFVKGQIFTGEGIAAERANRFWDSIISLNPPQRWYPSVGGSVLEKSDDIDHRTKTRRSLVSRLRWTNIGMSKTPVNIEVPTASTIPFGVLAKCWGSAGLDLNKAVAESTCFCYQDFKEKMSGAMLKSYAPPSIDTMFEQAVSRYGLPEDEAAEYVERFMTDLGRSLDRMPAPMTKSRKVFFQNLS